MHDKLLFFQHVLDRTLKITGYNYDMISRIEVIKSKIERVFYANNTECLQRIQDDITSLIRAHGTERFDDLLIICFDEQQVEQLTADLKHHDVYSFMQVHFQPKGFLIEEYTQTGTGNNNNNNNNNIFTFDNSHKDEFHIRIYHNGMKRNLYIRGELINISTKSIGWQYRFIRNTNLVLRESLKDYFSQHNFSNTLCYIDRYIATISAEEYLLFYKNIPHLVNQFRLMQQNYTVILTKSVETVMKEWLASDILKKREMMIMLFIFHELKVSSAPFHAHLLITVLYEIFQAQNQTQTNHKSKPNDLCQILPIDIVNMLQTKQINDVEVEDVDTLFVSQVLDIITNKKGSSSSSSSSSIIVSTQPKLSYEKQIAFLRVPDSVKDRALVKLKEIKNRSDDSSAKARQYLDGLLKIPFGIYRREEILCVFNEIDGLFDNMQSCLDTRIIVEQKGTVAIIDTVNKWQIIYHDRKKGTKEDIKEEDEEEEQQQQQQQQEGKDDDDDDDDDVDDIIDDNGRKLMLKHLEKKSKWVTYLKKLSVSSHLFKSYRTHFERFCHLNNHHHDNNNNNNNKKKSNQFPSLLLLCDDRTFEAYKQSVDSNFYGKQNTNKIFGFTNAQKHQFAELSKNFYGKLEVVKSYMIDIRRKLDKAIYSHDEAKTQLERIIAQWINGEQRGYCFGLEGPPGVGKTSLIKEGLSKLLVNTDGETRPFHLIAVGGDSNGSTFQGHNYTYVGSSWGNIVQILMDSKCMNPIILIDEVDKISKTENGRELIGILTHMLDSTQNTCFQDKYFAGVDFDLSQALIVLSYNDASMIDRVLLDRIHRIKFKSLREEEKVVIAANYLLPEIYKTFGMENNLIAIDDKCLFHIIQTYTCESGCRKLKQLLHDIVGEINLQFVKNPSCPTRHVVVNVEDLGKTYLKEYHSLIPKRVCEKMSSQVGVINCLWANSVGQGGVLTAHAIMFPNASRFLEMKMTGLMDEMMKESVEVASTLAWSLCTQEEIHTFMTTYNNSNHLEESKKSIKYGIHLHSGDGSVNKSGTSAGIALTLLLYSLFSNRKILSNVAVTGEADLDGSVNEIGGLDLKFQGGIKAGVKTFLFPTSNTRDYKDYIARAGGEGALDHIRFVPIDHIHEALSIVFEENR